LRTVVDDDGGGEGKTNKPVLFMVHGWPDNPDVWNAQVEAFKGKSVVMVFAFWSQTLTPETHTLRHCTPPPPPYIFARRHAPMCAGRTAQLWQHHHLSSRV
jgi:hypothetical protein